METERDRGEWLTLVCVHQIKLFGLGKKKLTRERKNNKIKVSFFSAQTFLKTFFMKCI